MSSGPPGDRPRSYVVLALLCMSIAILGCAAAQRGDRAGTSDAHVLVQSNVADAELWVDERFVAQVGTLRNGIALSPGEHRIELRHDQYHTHYSELSVAPGEQRMLRVELAEILP